VNTRKLPKSVIFWGGTGQARAGRAIADAQGSKLVAIFDDTPGLRSPFSDVPIYQGWDGFLSWIGKQQRNEIGFVIAIGNPHSAVRLKIAEKLKGEGLMPASLIHPAAIVAEDVQIGEGCQIMAGAVLGSEVVLGNQCIVQTNCDIEHETALGDGVEAQPQSTILGLCKIGAHSTIGAGAIVLARTVIGTGALVGAGAVVDRAVADGEKFLGPSARVI